MASSNKESKLVQNIKLASQVVQALGILLVAISLIYMHVQTTLLSDQVEEIRNANKRMYTFDLLGDLSENGAISDANFAMVQLINANARIDCNEENIPFITNEESIPEDILKNLQVDDNKIVTLLNFYELIGTAYVNDALDKDLVLHVRGGPMARALDVCEKYIETRGKFLGAEKLYENFIRVVEDFRKVERNI